jgi:uncharacterized membrane protein
MSGGLSTGPTVLASFAASLVEFVEALTVVLAVGAVRGWRWALIGTVAAVAVLAALVGLFGQSIARVPLEVAQGVVGILLLMFGLRWLRKAILRYAGAIALHDEEAAYAKETAALRAAGSTVSRAWDSVAFAAAFKIVMLEGIEVVFIVIAIGAGGQSIVPASLGAAAALLVVVGLGLALHRPLANIPENTLKFAVGILLSAFGTFWVGEGMHFEWPAADWSLLLLIAVYFLVAQALVIVCRSRYRRGKPGAKQFLRPDNPEAKQSMRPGKPGAKPSVSVRPKGALGASIKKLIALFVDDVALAAGVLVWAAAAALSAGRLSGDPLVQCVLFVAGLSGLLTYSALRAVRS